MRRLALALVTIALGAPACGGSGLVGTPGPLDADVDVDAELDVAQDSEAVDAGALPATTDGDGGPSEPTPSDAELVDAADVDLDADADAGPDLPLTRPVECRTDEECVVSCIPESWCDDGECAQDQMEWGCIIADEEEVFETCIEDHTPHPDHSCLMCNRLVMRGAWTGSSVRDDFEMGMFGTFKEVIQLVPGNADWAWSEWRAATGEHALYFGDPNTLTYASTGGRIWSLIETGWFPVLEGGEPELSFLVWMETEETPGFDVFRVVGTLESGETLELWSSEEIGGATDGVFEQIVRPVPELQGQTIKLTLEFDSVDGLLNDFEGVYVDLLTLATGCCSRDEECRDADACTEGTCPEVGALCVLEEREEFEHCCTSAVDCDDDDVCTVETCPEPGGPCVWEQVAECCHQVADCDDSDPCTEDTCPVDGGSGTCVHQPLCCLVDDDCDDGDPCTAGTCVEEQCAYEPSCCTSDAACLDGDPCTIDSCVGGACVNESAQLPGCCVPEVYSETFDAGAPAGWTFEPLDGGVGWQVASVGVALSAPGALYYGNPATLNFDNGAANQGIALSAPIEVPEGSEARVSFAVWYDGEDDTALDRFWLEVEPAAGSTQQLTSSSNLAVQSWTTPTLDLSSLAGQTVRLVFRFDSVDALVNTGLGVVIDDLEVTTTCAPKACAEVNDCPSQDGCLTGLCEDGSCSYVNDCCGSSGECEDGLICTSDQCVVGHCEFTQVPGCCEDAGDCDDGDPCTIDGCTGFGGECTHALQLGCCSGNTDCDDAESCTIDQCIGSACVHTYICCAADSECDDGDDICTDDQCTDSFCSYAPTGVEGCCVEEPIAWDFEVPVSFSTEASAPPCGWQVGATDQATSGGQTLWYGNPITGDYDCGVNTGSAVSEPVFLAPGLAYRLEMQLQLDVEDNTSYDLFWIELLAGDVVVDYWTKHELDGIQQWAEVSKDVSGLAGQSIQLRFVFDSKDGIANYGGGVFIDDVVLRTDCVPVACATDAGCVDDLPGTVGACDLATCLWTLP